MDGVERQLKTNKTDGKSLRWQMEQEHKQIFNVVNHIDRQLCLFSIKSTQQHGNTRNTA